MRRTRSTRRSRAGVTALAVAAVAALLAVGPVSATTDFKEHYSFDYEFPECDDAVFVSGHVDGVAHLRVGKGEQATAFFAHDRFTFVETWTGGGSFVTVSGRAIFQETTAVPVGVNLFEFTAHVSGQPFTVHDADGNLLIRDRGSLRETILFDTGGDNVPGGTFIESLSTKVSGPHPGLDFDICGYLLN